MLSYHLKCGRRWQEVGEWRELWERVRWYWFCHVGWEEPVRKLGQIAEDLGHDIRKGGGR